MTYSILAYDLLPYDILMYHILAFSPYTSAEYIFTAVFSHNYKIFNFQIQILYYIFTASLPVPGGYNPYGKSSNHESKNSSNNSEASQKLKKTVQTLEASLAKKNKEIAEMKKAKHDSEDNNMESLAEVVARVQALRVNHNPKDDQRVRDKVCLNMWGDIFKKLVKSYFCPFLNFGGF